jgi:hypothetical protein
MLEEIHDQVRDLWEPKDHVVDMKVVYVKD